MPQVILWALGVVGAAVVAKWVAKEVRRVNAELDAVRTAPVAGAASDRGSLERDPDGVYRPKS